MPKDLFDKMAEQKDINPSDLETSDFVDMLIHAVHEHTKGNSRTINALAGIVQKVCTSNPDIKL